MKKLFLLPIGTAAIAMLVAVAGAGAASPSPAPLATPWPSAAPRATAAPVGSPAPTTAPVAGTSLDPLAGILGLTDAEIMALRQDGLTLAQIAERQKVDPQKLIDALVAQWSGRIDARVAFGALTADQAATLKANLQNQATAMLNATMGGMRGAAVGAGPNGAMRGMGAANGAPGAAGNGASGARGMGPGMRGANRGGAMHGPNGTGTCAACAAASPTPAP